MTAQVLEVSLSGVGRDCCAPSRKGCCVIKSHMTVNKASDK